MRALQLVNTKMAIMAQVNKSDIDKLREIVGSMNNSFAEPAGNVAAFLAGQEPSLAGDREGLIRLGVAILQYATTAELCPGKTYARRQKIGRIFASTSHIRDVSLTIHEDLNLLPKQPQGCLAGILYFLTGKNPFERTLKSITPDDQKSDSRDH
jgi:hypothetical protein